MAAPERPAAAVVGDGGFLIAPGSVATAVEYGIPAVWHVWITIGDCPTHGQQRGYLGGNREIAPSFEDIAICRLPSADFAAMARAMGARGAAVERPGDLRERIALAIASNEPYLHDVRVARDIQPVVTGSWGLPPRPHPGPAFGLAGKCEEW